MKTCHNCACDPVCDHNWNGWETCGNWIQKPEKPPTNADRIRAMNDEELAWELMTWRCEAVAKFHGIEGIYPDTQKTILDWLQQPVEEET